MEKVHYGTQSITFSIKRTKRKTLGIEVHPDLSVWAISPLNTSLEEIKNRILKRGSWIFKQQNYFDQFLPRTPHREYVSGETHLYLGRRYVLRVKESTEESVKLKLGQLIVRSTRITSNQIKQLLAGWYYLHAKRVFQEAFENALKKFKKYNLTISSFEIRRMKNRWGSCTPKGKIIINPEIIKTNKRCIEYVMIHELCHLIISNHNKEFYALQDEILPNNEKIKEQLERIMV